MSAAKWPIPVYAPLPMTGEEMTGEPPKQLPSRPRPKPPKMPAERSLPAFWRPAGYPA